jgi:DNA mismatch endonuclease (patch repair protein)
MDRISKKHRSWNMSRIKNKNTQPEIIIRSLLHKLGYRFRLHRRDLPGIPDIVLPKYKTAIFVHGCFWHRHSGCKFAYSPKSRVQFWEKKFERNVSVQKKAENELDQMGWRVFVIWECELANLELVMQKLTLFLKENRSKKSI